MTKLQQFFYDNAGYAYSAIETAEQEHIAYAIKLAKAVHYAIEQGWSYEWADDNEPCNCGASECNHTVEYCLLQSDDGITVLGSLSGISGPTSEYRRVVEAELALEAMHAHLKA